MNETTTKKKTNDKKAQKENPPNIIFVGRRTRLNKETLLEETVLREAPAFLIDGGIRIALPLEAEQKRGFYSDEANRIIEAFPNDYKLFAEKGKK